MERLKAVADSFSLQKLTLSLQNQCLFVSMKSNKDLNSLSSKMLDQLSSVIRKFDSQEDVKVIVLKSEVPKFFCAGANIKEFSLKNYDKDLVYDRFKLITQVLYISKKPIITAVRGKALGGGFELALFGDIILASQATEFALPELNLGLIPGLGGTQRLSKLIGRHKASLKILTGEPIKGKQAFQLGIVSKLVAQDNFDQQVRQIAFKIAQKSMASLLTAKASIKMAEQVGTGVGLAFERAVFWPLFSTKGAEEGISAFKQKRKSNFKGI